MTHQISEFQQQLHMQKLQSLGQLAGGVAHDFNNILSIIQGYTRMIDKQLGTDHPAHDKLEHILTATQRGASLTKRLLAFGRQQILADASCDLRQVIFENEVLLRPLLTRQIELVLPPKGEAFFVPCDSDIISQILINLAVNARDAITSDGQITISVSATQEHVTLHFADNGSGIPEDIKMKIFDPFFTTKEQGKGTGLGLSMVSGFMQQIHGSIDVDSTHRNGTTFHLNFPRLQPVSQKAKPGVYSVEHELNNKTILIVDDEEAMLPVLEAQLQEMGMKVLKAANADTALLLQEDYGEKIDLLLTDVVMPGLNGVRLSELLTSLRPDTGVVFMTGYANRADALNNISPLPEDALVVPKPLDPDDLSPALLKALERVESMHLPD